MFFFLLLLAAIVCMALRPAPANAFNRDYLSIENTTAVKGIFAILVVFTHSVQYISATGAYDLPYMAFRGFLGQMVVSMFLFYSGYGIMLSIAKKGFPYICTLPRKRFLQVLVNFDLAVLLYLLLNLALGKNYGVANTLLAFTGFTSIGNSNWYIFAILVLYLLTFIAFFGLKWSESKRMLYIGALLLTVMTVAVVYLEMKLDLPSYFYNTMILFPLGCWYALLKDTIDKLMFKNDLRYILTATFMLAALCLTYMLKLRPGIEGYTLWAITFTLSIVLFTMKFSFKSAILDWFGKHLFSVYILQRIPMILLNRLGVAKSHKYLFVLLSLGATIVLALLFDALTERLWKRLAGNKQKQG